MMNNQEYNSFKKKMNVYKNFVNTNTLNRLSSRVKIGNLDPGQGLVSAKNAANVEYKKKTISFYATVLRTGVFNKKEMPTQPPCIPVNGGKSGRRKTTEAVAQMCGGFCARQVQKACGAVGGAAKTVVGLGKRRRPVSNNTGRINNTIRIEKIRNLVKNGVLKNVNNNGKNNTRYVINTMSENQLRKLARTKSITIPLNLSKT